MNKKFLAIFILLSIGVAFQVLVWNLSPKSSGVVLVQSQATLTSTPSLLLYSGTLSQSTRIPEHLQPQTSVPTLASALAPESAALQLTLATSSPDTMSLSFDSAHFDLTDVVSLILARPTTYVGQEVKIVGYYRGWDLLGEVGTGPPVTRSDWVIADSSGAVYVMACNGFAQSLELDPSLHDVTHTVLSLAGIVRLTDENQPYIEPTSLAIVKR